MANRRFMMKKIEAFTLDSMAMRLAAEMGHAWNEMCAFPGYMRNIWRDEARERVRRDMPGAVFEIQHCPWEDADIEYIVKTPDRR